MSEQTSRPADLAHIRADRSRMVALRQTRQYERDAGYKRDLEDFDWILQKRERQLELEVRT